MILFSSTFQEVSAYLQEPEAVSISFIDLAIKGGWVMIPILLLSFIAIYIYVERYYVITKAGKEDINFMNRIKDYIYDSKIDAALALCRSNDGPAAHMVEKGINRLGRPLSDVSTAIENRSVNLRYTNSKRDSRTGYRCRRCTHDRVSRNSDRYDQGILRYG
jgi:biopolymer transport protein ExbB